MWCPLFDGPVERLLPAARSSPAPGGRQAFPGCVGARHAPAPAFLLASLTFSILTDNLSSVLCLKEKKKNV